MTYFSSRKGMRKLPCLPANLSAGKGNGLLKKRKASDETAESHEDKTEARPAKNRPLRKRGLSTSKKQGCGKGDFFSDNKRK